MKYTHSWSLWHLILVALLTISFSGCRTDSPDKPENQITIIQTFNNAHHAFGEGLSQSAVGSFNFPIDPQKVEKIEMYIRLRCPEGGCNAWDVFANVSVWDNDLEQWLEMGRYITPYGVDNSQAGRGFRIDVTDFRSLLYGEVDLRSFIEVWGSDGWLVSVEFEITEGEPDYKYSAIAPVLHYADWSLGGIPYGEEHQLATAGTIALTGESEKTTLRTIITGWGHATPHDPDGRPCAEWCFRTHQVHINNQHWFSHHMEGLGCAENPVQPQGGNWEPDRAGWCPGMAVPVRRNVFLLEIPTNPFTLEYVPEPWENDFQSQADNPHAYYAISCFLVTEGNTPQSKVTIHHSHDPN